MKIIPLDSDTAVFQEVNKEYPGLVQINKTPPMYAIKNFLSDEECDKLIEKAKPELKRSTVVAPDGIKNDEVRTSETCHLNKNEGFWFAEKVSRLLNISRSHQEPVQVARYSPGQFYKAHYDSFNEEIKPGQDAIKLAGQRIATVLIYLNQPSSGGATNFPYLGIRAKPRKGTALVFFPCTVDGKMDPLTLHAAEDAEDEKWVSQIWVRQGKLS
jgi:prolyl 4-hydroxylase